MIAVITCVSPTTESHRLLVAELLCKYTVCIVRIVLRTYHPLIRAIRYQVYTSTYRECTWYLLALIGRMYICTYYPIPPCVFLCSIHCILPDIHHSFRADRYTLDQATLLMSPITSLLATPAAYKAHTLWPAQKVVWTCLHINTICISINYTFWSNLIQRI
jgi:hypothetical protein